MSKEESFQERIREAFKKAKINLSAAPLLEMDFKSIELPLRYFSFREYKFLKNLHKINTPEPGDSRDADGKTWRDRGPLL